MFDLVRYVLALFLVMAAPAVVLFWFSIHPLIGFWRKAGVALAYAVHLLMMGLVGAVVFYHQDAILTVDFGTNPVLIALALPLYACGFWLSAQRKGPFRKKVLVGLSELSPVKHSTPLITTGIYSRIRHPRYAELLILLLAHSLLANYLAVYVAYGFTLFGILVIVRLEEKELRERFGAEYEEYCRCTPRFIPRLSPATEVGSAAKQVSQSRAKPL